MILNRHTGWFELSPVELKAKLLRLNELYDIPLPKDITLGQSTHYGARIAPKAIPKATLEHRIRVTVKKRKTLGII